MSTCRAKWRIFIDTCKNIYTPVILTCIFFYIFQNGDLLVDIFSEARSDFLINGIIIWASLHLLAPLSPKFILRGLGYSLSYKELLTIHITRLPARYLPGGIWHTVGRLADYRSYGVAKKHLSFLAFFETVFPIPITFFTGSSLLWIFSSGILPDSFLITCSTVSLAMLIAPGFISRWIPIVNNAQVKTLYSYLCLVLISAVFWFLAAVSFLFYFNSFTLIESAQNSFLSVAGAYIFAWGAGYISIFAPQGIGIFEIVAGRIIDLPMNLGSSVAFLAGFRLIALMADVVIYSLFNLFITSKK